MDINATITDINATASYNTTSEFTPQPDKVHAVYVEAQEYILYKIGLGIHSYYLPVMIIVGFVGNILSLMVMMQPGNRSISSCVYMGALAVLDSMQLYIAAHYWAITGPVKLLARGIYEWECKVLMFLLGVSICCY